MRSHYYHVLVYNIEIFIIVFYQWSVICKIKHNYNNIVLTLFSLIITKNATVFTEKKIFDL